MGKTKYDGVVEAVHYGEDGLIDWVRVYRRRGSTFSDRLLMKRDEFIQELKSRRKYFSGKRLTYLASTFEISEEVRLLEQDDREFIVIGDSQAEKDRLRGVPVI
jgi:hypothetical protein